MQIRRDRERDRERERQRENAREGAEERETKMERARAQASGRRGEGLCERQSIAPCVARYPRTKPVDAVISLLNVTDND